MIANRTFPVRTAGALTPLLVRKLDRSSETDEQPLLEPARGPPTMRDTDTCERGAIPLGRPPDRWERASITWRGGDPQSRRTDHATAATRRNDEGRATVPEGVPETVEAVSGARPAVPAAFEAAPWREPERVRLSGLVGDQARADRAAAGRRGEPEVVDEESGTNKLEPGRRKEGRLRQDASRALPDPDRHRSRHLREHSEVIEVRVRDQDAEQARVALADQPRDIRQRNLCTRARRDRPAQVEHDPHALGLELDAVAANFFAPAVDPDPHASPSWRPWRKPRPCVRSGLSPGLRPARAPGSPACPPGSASRSGPCHNIRARTGSRDRAGTRFARRSDLHRLVAAACYVRSAEHRVLLGCGGERRHRGPAGGVASSNGLENRWGWRPCRCPPPSRPACASAGLRPVSDLANGRGGGGEERLAQLHRLRHGKHRRADDRPPVENARPGRH